MLATAIALFRASNGKSFALLKEDLILSDGDLLFSSDGEKFYALSTTGQGSSSYGEFVEMKVGFTNPRLGTSGRLLYSNRAGVIVCDEEFYFKQDGDEHTIEIVPLPSSRRAEYLCKAEDGTLIYVSSDKYNGGYDSFQLYIGDGENMRQIQVKDVNRYRDGGTTYVITEEETFFSPSPVQQDPDVVPTWGEQKLTSLDPRDHDIVETRDGQVTIKLN